MWRPSQVFSWRCIWDLARGCSQDCSSSRSLQLCSAGRTAPHLSLTSHPLLKSVDALRDIKGDFLARSPGSPYRGPPPE